jgi:hypothetical protein
LPAPLVWHPHLTLLRVNPDGQCAGTAVRAHRTPADGVVFLGVCTPRPYGSFSVSPRMS